MILLVYFLFLFLGHYIILIGYEQLGDEFIYRDPSIRHRFCKIRTKDFELARSAKGTDDDCIVVKL